MSPSGRAWVRVFVSRQRLLDRLSPSSGTALVALLAPLGYGKTSLLIDHAERQGRPVAWLTLDARDNDPVVLVSRIVAALDRVTAVDDSVQQALAAPDVSIWGRLMPRLAATIAGLPSCLIALDDIHEIASDDARDVVAWLALHMPQDAQLIISGCVDGSLMSQVGATTSPIRRWSACNSFLSYVSFSATMPL